jgi:hypothetical protein
MNTTVLFNKQPNKPLEVNICPISDWDGFDKIIQFLKNEYSAEILSQVDGPGSRRWVVKIKNQEIELRHDDGYGNYLFAPSLESEEIVREIGRDLENRLQEI